MVSLVICSRKAAVSRELLTNIDETVGVPYEVIFIDNSENRYSIFSAYNRGASMAKYDLLCFMHDDIRYHTGDWGVIAAKKLAEKTTGVLGVAGAVLKTRMPSPWWISNMGDHRAYLRYNIVQHSSAGAVRQQAAGEKEGETWSEALVLDGVWLCCRKEVWEKGPFDEQRYKGFHFYDMDLSLTAFRNGYKNYVSQEILLEHFSSGHADGGWIRESKIFQDKWGKLLPMNIGRAGADEMKELEDSALRSFLTVMIHNGYRDPGLWLKYWLRAAVRAPFAKATLQLLTNYGKSFFRGPGR